MKSKKLRLISLAALFSLGLIGFVFGQTAEYPDDVVNEPWINANNVWYEMPLRLRLDRYDINNFREFKTRIVNLSEKAYLTSWEGIYHDQQTQLGKTELRLSFNKGFVQYYVYSCLPELRWLSYGTATDMGDSILLSSNFDSNKKAATAKSFVKVEWGTHQYLVAENSLEAFSKKAAGLWVEPPQSDEYVAPEWSDYWTRGETEGSPTGLPKLPARFSHLERQPITGVIVNIRRPKRFKELELQTGTSTQYISNGNLYPVTINKGSRHGVKPGMTFGIVGFDDEIVIRTVGRDSSYGIIVREFDEENVENCFSDDGTESTCSTLRTKLTISTKTGRSSFF